MLDTATPPPTQDLFSRLADYRGPVSLPGSRRQVWWTGRVAIGLRYQGGLGNTALSSSEHWIQEQLLRS